MYNLIKRSLGRPGRRLRHVQLVPRPGHLPPHRLSADGSRDQASTGPGDYVPKALDLWKTPSEGKYILLERNGVALAGLLYWEGPLLEEVYEKEVWDLYGQ